ncbi:MAG: MBL fold metallo-hydrolase [Hyphomicrobiales bacterium]|nr:MBL fold metallo-hydrolase [Hyphomicrobiales bacterium]
MRTLLVCLFGLLSLAIWPQGASAQGSRCFAMANANPPVQLAALAPRKLTPQEVLINFVGHSTFLMETAAGVTIATDYAGFAGFNVTPDVVTMNNAHETHFTDYPDEKIRHVLRGWNPNGGPAQHNLRLEDVHIRNVPTDRRGWGAGIERDGNSIFIFETADLCIGHLGHLHHGLTPQYRALLGTIDVLMVPVDGTFTLGHKEMAEVVRLLRSRLILPMHYFGGSSLQSFLTEMHGEFQVKIHDSSQVIVSQQTLPKTPTMLVLPAGHGFSSGYD